MSTAASTPLKTERQPDANYLSLERNGQTLFAGTTEARPTTPPYDGMEIGPEEPKQWDTALKCSGRYGTHLRGLNVAQCRENALDINNVSNDLDLEGDWGLIGREGEQVITVKGGSYDCRVAGEVWSRGTRADVAVGLWSDQSTTVSHHLDFRGLTPSSVRLLFDQPLTFIICRVNQPWRAWFGFAPKDIQLPEDARVLKLKSLGAQLHWVAKWLAVKIGVIKARR